MTTLWQFMNQLKPILCKHYGTYRVYYAYLIVWTFLYLWIYLFFFLFPRPLLRYMGTFRANPVAIRSAIAIRGRCCEWGGTIFIAFIGRYFYCTLTRQFILHLHRYNILRFLWGTQFWVSRSKKCLVKEWQYLVFLGTP